MIRNRCDGGSALARRNRLTGGFEVVGRRHHGGDVFVTGELDIATQRQGAEAPVDAALVLHLEEDGPETQRKAFDAGVEQARDTVVTILVEGHDHGNDQQERQNARQKLQQQKPVSLPYVLMVSLCTDAERGEKVLHQGTDGRIGFERQNHVQVIPTITTCVNRGRLRR